MTQEDKELLLKDLSARLPYGVMVRVEVNDVFIKPTDEVATVNTINMFERPQKFRVTPYLRPMSSMTEEEKDYIKNVARFKQSDGIHYDDGMHYIPIYQETLDDQWKTGGKFPPILDDIYRFMFDYGYTILVDWLNAHHFDYRGLIEKGLALEAPKDMYEF